MSVKDKRLSIELNTFTLSFMNDGIDYFHNGDEGYGLIKGSSDTPYADGFYIIKFRFPSTYPFKPPECNHISISGLRQSPNFHDNGCYVESASNKVCLSRLNTWDGGTEGKDRWTSSLGIEYILKMIQAQVLTTKPLDNEPNYRHTIENPNNAQNYENFVIYHNYRSNVVDIYKKLVTNEMLIPCTIAKHIMDRILEYVITHKSTYINKFNELKDVHHGLCYNCSTYTNSSCYCDYDKLIKDFEHLFGNKIAIRLKIKNE
jgi:ubiquitin-protein ligase